MLFIDAFPANNEIPIIDFRIRYLFDEVDYFVIAESHNTHSGYTKPLYITDWLKAHPDLSQKVKILIVESRSRENFSATWGAWENEMNQRTKLASFIHSTFANARYVLSDADEIPSLRQISLLKTINTPRRFITPCSYLYANYMGASKYHKNWSHGLMNFTSNQLLENGGRYSNFPIVKCTEPGIHLSYQLFDLPTLQTKLESNAPQRFNQAYMKSKKYLEFCADMAISPLGEFHSRGFGLLKVHGDLSLSNIQEALFRSLPHLFSSKSSSYLVIHRIFYSLVVSSIQRQYWNRQILLETFIYRSKKKRFIHYLYVFREICYPIEKNFRKVASKLKRI